MPVFSLLTLSNTRHSWSQVPGPRPEHSFPPARRRSSLPTSLLFNPDEPVDNGGDQSEPDLSDSAINSPRMGETGDWNRKPGSIPC